MTPMIEGSPFQQRARSNQLRFNEQAMHDELMKTRVTFWPESLQEFVQERINQLGLCGDVVSTAVADWIARR
jgi:hypothetical protein